jgi:hypothetical protein
MRRIRLGVNIDHVATLRQARRGREPEPLAAAALAELGGADQITVHLREDRRHIQDRDLELLRRTVATGIDLEMAAVPEMVRIARRVRPELATLVPEKRQEITTEGGLDVAGQARSLAKVAASLQRGGIRVSLFVDPVPAQVLASRASGAEPAALPAYWWLPAFEPERAPLPSTEPTTWVPWPLGSLQSPGRPRAKACWMRPRTSWCTVLMLPVSRPLSATATTWS